MHSEHELLIDPEGTVACVYADELGVGTLAAALGGKLRIRRASHVEPLEDGSWVADMSPSGGPLLGPFKLRSEALLAERVWLSENDLGLRGAA